MTERRIGKAQCGGPSSSVELHYEDIGDLGDPPVLLIMGVGAQLPMWPDGCVSSVTCTIEGAWLRRTSSATSR